MKYIIVGDLHLKFSKRTINSVSENIYYAVENLRYAAKLAKENNAKIVLLGDLIDEKTYIHQTLLDTIISELRNISKEIEVIVVVGNHDYVYSNGKQTSYLYSLDFLRVTKENEIMYIDNVAFIGHHEKDQMLELLKEACLNSDIIVSHFGLDEASLSNNYKVKAEASIKDFDIYSDSKLFVLGHYHKPQELVRNNNKFIYVGSVQPCRADEYLDRKRIAILDSETKKVDFIDSIQPEWVKVEISNREDEEKVYEEICGYLENGKNVYIVSKIIPSKQITELAKNQKIHLTVKLDKTQLNSVTSINEPSTIDIFNIISEYLKQNKLLDITPEIVKECEKETV